MGADDVAVEMVDDEAAPLELRLDVVRDRRLAGARQTGEPENEPAHVCSPHSVRSVPAQRPSRPLPGCVECVSPIDSYPWSCSLLYGRARSRIYAQQSSSLQSASGLAFQSSYVSGNRCPVSIAKTRALGSSSKSMSSRTDSSFWNEQASATRPGNSL